MAAGPTVRTATRPWLVYAGAAVAMVAFAANSLLTRSALDSDSVDAATFTTLRLLSGAVALTAILAARTRSTPRVLARPAPWRSAAFLFTYAAAFSLAYLRIGAETGALVLFGTVQTVMYGAAIRRRERIGATGWTGLALAAAGLVVLVAPGVTAPDLGGIALMALAGAAWAGYTLAGRATTDPISASARNFVWSLPLVVASSSSRPWHGPGPCTPTRTASRWRSPPGPSRPASAMRLVLRAARLAACVGYPADVATAHRRRRRPAAARRAHRPARRPRLALILTGVAVGVVGGRRRR